MFLLRVIVVQVYSYICIDNYVCVSTIKYQSWQPCLDNVIQCPTGPFRRAASKVRLTAKPWWVNSLPDALIFL